MSSAPPPHPGSAWQQCQDQGSGYPYYWNTTSNQVRWDCPPEFRQWQISLAKPPPVSLPPPKLVTDVKLATVQPEARSNSSSPTPVASKPPVASALVSGYDSDSEEDDGTSQHSETNKSETTEEASAVEAQPDFIGPVIPKPSSDADKDSENTSDQNEPPPPGSDSEENDALLLKRLKDKSDTLNQMGGEIDNDVKDIIDPENIAKIESDLADDILSQIEAEKPPDYLGQKPLFPCAVAQPPLPAQQSQPPLPPQPAAKPLPRRPLQPSSMLQLACNYGHESDSDTEDIEPPVRKAVNKVTNKMMPVTGQLDSLGRMVFNQAGSGPGWQTEEQREALESYKAQSISESQTNGVDESHSREKFETVSSSGSRKRRLALPGGRFNKTDQREVEETTKVDSKTEFKPMMNFVKSSSTIPGTITESDKKENIKATVHSNEDKELVLPDVGTQATELVEKLEYFKVGEEKVSSLKTLAIKLETLYSAWAAGALSLPYLNIVLQNAKKKIEEAENSLETAPWKALWDRDKRTYTFRNELNGKEKNDREASMTPPPGTPPPLPSESRVLPPLPPPDAPLPAPPPSADHQLQDMEIDDEPTVNITDEISNFYLEMQESDPAVPLEIPDKLEDDVRSNSSAPSSAPGSPAPPEMKKRKRVKVSNNISLKKKGVGDMLAKWQKINN